MTDETPNPYEIIDDLLINFVFVGNDIPAINQSHATDAALRALAAEYKRNPETPLTMTIVRWLIREGMIE